MEFVIITLSIVIGLSLVFGGYRFARFAIPFMGFLTGLSLGGALIADSTTSSFLATTLGIVVGVVLGIVLAALAYMYYYLAVVVLAASLGYWAGSGFVLLLGFEPGILSALIGIGLELL